MDRHHSACAASSRDLPPLSPTYQTSRLLTPDNLYRCTSDPAHYREYLMHSLRMDPPDRNALSVRTQLYGDNNFLIHRYVGIHQPHFRTSIHPSDTRPTDDIVAKPLRVMHSEISTPFPAQHPFTSHISKFAVFPETQPYQFHPLASSSTSSRPSLVSSATQTQPTDLSSYRYLMPRPTAPFYVLKKASENNVRVERCHHLEESEEMISNGATLWDLPRSQRHMRTTTYPAPVVQCPVHPSPISPGSREALRSIYHQVMLSTSYSQHFSPSKPSQCIPVLRNESQQSLPSRGEGCCRYSWLRPLPEELHSECHNVGCSQDKMEEGDEVVEDDKPWVTEPSGKGHTHRPESMDLPFEGCAQMLESEGAQVLIACEEQGTLNHPMSPGCHKMPHHVPSITKEDEEVQNGEGGTQVETGTNHSCGCARLDKATQTDQSHWEYSLSTDVQQPHGTLQALVPQHHCTSTKNHTRSLTYPMPAQSPYLISLCPTTQEPSLLLQTPSYTPRSVLVGQRMGSLLRFSKSEARRRFHALYPEGAPNLKEHKSHSENERRHVINGFNAYYYH
ncbi:hypothetical protein EMCRGX_G005992 [Ephydatia muelleri]